MFHVNYHLKQLFIYTYIYTHMLYNKDILLFLSEAANLFKTASQSVNEGNQDPKSLLIEDYKPGLPS